MKAVQSKGEEFRWLVIPETWCSNGYGSVGEHEMKSDRDSREGETGY